MIFYTTKEKLEPNLIASIFHPEGLVVRGSAIVFKYNIKEEIVDCTKEDIINLLIKRREHTGLHIKNNKIEYVTIDNRWNLFKSDVKLSTKTKKMVSCFNYFLIVISDEPCEIFDENEKYIFSLLDYNKKNIIDFSKEEFGMLSLNKDKKFEDFSEVFSPFNHLQSSV
jgi:hypothetical protein